MTSPRAEAEKALLEECLRVAADPDLQAAVQMLVAVHQRMGWGGQEKHYLDGLRQIAAERNTTADWRVQMHLDACDAHGKPLHVPTATRYADALFRGRVVVEMKAQAGLNPQHLRQLVDYMTAAGAPLGILVNFQRAPLSGGLEVRVVFRTAAPAPGADFTVLSGRIGRSKEVGPSIRDLGVMFPTVQRAFFETLERPPTTPTPTPTPAPTPAPAPAPAPLSVATSPCPGPAAASSPGATR